MAQSSAKSSTPSNVMLLMIVIMGVAMTYARARGNIGLMHICQYLLIGASMGLFGLSFLKSPQIKGADLILFLLILYVLLQGVFAGVGGLIAAGAFCQMLTTWRSAEQVRISPTMVKTIIFCEAAVGMLLIYLSTTPQAYAIVTQKYGRRIIDSLTLGFANPNETGLVLFSVIVILLIATQNVIAQSKWRFLIYAEVVYLFVLLVKTDARTSLLTCSLSIIAILLKLGTKKLRKHTFIVMCIVLLHVPFCYLYIAMAKMSEYAKLEFMGKKLMSGRQHMFAHALNSWTNSLFGNLADIKFGNMHNAGLTILVTLGIIGYILYLAYTAIKAKELYHTHYRGYGVYPIVALLSLFLIGYTEAAVFCAGNIFYINLLLILCLAHNASSRFAQKKQ